MGNTEEVLLRITGDSSGGERALKRMVPALTQFKSKVDQAAKAGRLLGVVFGGLAAAGGKLIQSTARVAMRNEVLALSLYTVGENAGFGREELSALVDQVKALGITTSEARLGLTRMIQGELDLAKATDLARTAQDLAVIAGENSSETFGSLMQAVTALQPRLLRKYGIVTTLNQALGDLANSTDAAAKRNRMLEYVLEEGTKVAGVYEQAMGVVGKRITSLPRLLEEAKAAFGKHFIPIIGKGVDILAKLLKMFEALPEGVQRALAMAVLFGTAISAVVAAIAGLAVALPFIISGLSALAGLIGGVVSTIGAWLIPILAALAAAVGSLIAIGAVLVSAWRSNWGGIRDAVAEAWQKIKPLLQQLVGLISGWGAEFKRQALLIWAAVKTILEPLFVRLAGFIRSIDWADLFLTFKDAINVAGGYITALLKTIRGLLSGEGLRSFMPLRDAMVDVLTLIALTWQKYIRQALVWGYNLVVQAANGIIRAAQTVMVKAMQFLGNIIGLFLKPGSPPKKGPLSRIIEWGRGLINTYIKSFALADFSLMRDALSPFRDALENAMRAGDIDTAGFVDLFGKVREQVAALISEFRKTGEIGEAALQRIAATMGEGSEELVEYLRLQLEHQKALDHLKDVQEEVAAAEAKGFVPADLKAKLKAAQEAADASKEQVDWQREYLDMQQESVDLQLRLVEALESLASAGGGAGAGAGVGAGVGDGLGLGDLGAGLDLGDLDEDLDDVLAELGEMSDEFAAMRERVLTWIESFKTWLALPIEGKIATIAEKLTEVTGIDFAGLWEKIDEKGLLNVLGEIVGAAWDHVLSESLAKLEEIWGNIVTAVLTKLAELKVQWQANWQMLKVIIGAVWTSIKAAVIGKLLEIRTAIDSKIAEIRAAIEGKIEEIKTGWQIAWDSVLLITQTIWDNIKAQIKEHLQALFDAMGLDLGKMKARWEAIWEDVQLIARTVWERIITAVTEKVAEIRQTIESNVQALKDWWDTNWNVVKTILETVWGAIVAIVTEKVRKVYDEITTNIQKLKDWWDTNWNVIKTILRTIWLAIVTVAKEKIQEVYDAVTKKLGEIGDWIDLQVARFRALGSAIIEGIKEGVLAKAGELIDSITGAIEDALEAAKRLLGISSPSSVAAKLIGRPFALGIAKGMLEGMDFSPLRAALQVELAKTQGALAGATGGLNVDQTFTGDWVFPNVRDGRDAGSIRQGIDRQALEAGMATRTGGG